MTRHLPVASNFAGENGAKLLKRVVESLVVNRRGQVLDEDITLSALPQSRVALGPHHAARAPFDVGKVHSLDHTSSILMGVDVHVGIPERATGDGIAADTNRSDRCHRVQRFKQRRLSGLKRGMI